LGLSETALSLIRETLKRSEGLILISGPTGAGKTMTLYSLASFLDLHSLIAVSVEDPVEFDLRYVRQIQADPEHRLSMPEALKTVLRMDPDIILIGEIRDAQSAIAAVRAAASGRFVLATLHATDVALAVEACQYFSVPRHLLGSALRLVTSQALVRRVCGECADRRRPSDEEREMFQAEGVEVPACVPRARGCEKCHDFGYSGRTGVFEVVALDHDMTSAISRSHGMDALRKMIARKNAVSLRQDALSKVAAGITTIEEVLDLHFPGESAHRTYAEASRTISRQDAEASARSPRCRASSGAVTGSDC
jgi:type II secretory ATPase GspE/PulE/Tfp pilus assembly ATPase PilB-like protein